MKFLVLSLSLLLVSFNTKAEDFDQASKVFAKTAFNDLYKQKTLLKEFNQPYRSGILVNIWATWCKPCVQEIPSLFALQKKFPDITVINLSVDKNEKLVKSFYKRNRIPLGHIPNLMDYSGRVSKSVGFSRVPTTLLIDNKGKIVDLYIGARKWDSSFMIAKLKASLKKSEKQRTYYYNY